MQSLNLFQKAVCRILQNGAIPEHIGFIMDGNRRHAHKMQMKDTLQGHAQGVKSLKKCLLICKHLNVHMISLYCFSTENFKRSQRQVNGLMELFLTTFSECSTLTQVLARQQIKVNVIGDFSLFRQDIQQCIGQIINRTQSYDKMIVNLCFGYDSLWQCESSIRKLDGKQSNYANFITQLSIPTFVDILVRTSNEKRLSNFLLPQCAYSYICILKEHWPEFGILSFCRILMEYNYHKRAINQQKQENSQHMRRQILTMSVNELHRQ